MPNIPLYVTCGGIISFSFALQVTTRLRVGTCLPSTFTVCYWRCIISFSFVLQQNALCRVPHAFLPLSRLLISFMAFPLFLFSVLIHKNHLLIKTEGPKGIIIISLHRKKKRFKMVIKQNAMTVGSSFTQNSNPHKTNGFCFNVKFGPIKITFCPWLLCYFFVRNCNNAYKIYTCPT